MLITKVSSKCYPCYSSPVFNFTIGNDLYFFDACSIMSISEPELGLPIFAAFIINGKVSFYDAEDVQIPLDYDA